MQQNASPVGARKPGSDGRVAVTDQNGVILHEEPVEVGGAAGIPTDHVTQQSQAARLGLIRGAAAHERAAVISSQQCAINPVIQSPHRQAMEELIQAQMTRTVNGPPTIRMLR